MAEEVEDAIELAEQAGKHEKAVRGLKGQGKKDKNVAAILKSLETANKLYKQALEGLIGALTAKDSVLTLYQDLVTSVQVAKDAVIEMKQASEWMKDKRIGELEKALSQSAEENNNKARTIVELSERIKLLLGKGL